MNIRRFLSFAALSVVMIDASAQTTSGAYPVRPVTITTPTTGGAADAIARTLGNAMGKSLGATFIVAAKPGAGGNVATESVAHSTPDGYTLLLALGSMLTVNPALYAKAGFNPTADFAPIGLVARAPYVLAVNPRIPANDVREFVAYAKAAKGPVFYSSPGNGTPNHILGILFNNAAGTKLEHVPYRTTGAATTDTMSGQVAATFGSMPSLLPFIRSGQLRGLAVTTSQRSSFAPDLPPIGESLPGFAFESWYVLVAPAGTSQQVIQKLAAALKKASVDKEVRAAFALQGVEVATGSPEALGELIRTDLARWSAVVKSNGIKVDN